MAKSQRVKNLAYLAVATIDIAELVASGESAAKAVLIPKDAEVVHISAEVIEAGDSDAKLDLGFEGEAEAVANDIALDNKGVNIANVVFSTPSTKELLATPSGATKGVVKVRVQYFLPSEITIEYQ